MPSVSRGHMDSISLGESAINTEESTPSQVVPFLVATLVCDTGCTDPSTQKKSLIGIFDRIVIGSFPSSRQVSLYFKVTDAEGYYPIGIEYANSDDNEVLATGNGELTVPDRNAFRDMLVALPRLPIPKPGRYEFRIKMSGFFLGNAVLEVIQRS